MFKPIDYIIYTIKYFQTKNLNKNENINIYSKMLSLVFCTSYEARGKLIQSANEDFFFWNTRCFRETCTELTIILYSCDYSGVNSFLKQYFFCIHIIFQYSYYFSCAGLVNYNLGVLGGWVIFWYLVITCKWIVCEGPIFVSKMKTLHFFFRVLSLTPTGTTRHKRPSTGPRAKIWATLIFGLF